MSENRKRKIDNDYLTNDNDHDGYPVVPGQSDATLLYDFYERPDKVQKASEYPADINYSQQDQREYIYKEYLQREQQQQYLIQQQKQQLQQHQSQIQSNIWNQAEQFIKKSGLESYAHQ